MSERRYTQAELDSVVNPQAINDILALEGLSGKELAEGRARIEIKYGMPPGILTRLSPSTGEEGERARIYKAHYEATPEEVDAMSMEQYKEWSALGYHLKKTPEEIQRDAEEEERDRARTAELEKIDKMSMEEYVAYNAAQERKAQQEKEEAAKLIEKERQGKFSTLRRKNPDDMTMEEYEQWTKVR